MKKWRWAFGAVLLIAGVTAACSPSAPVEMPTLAVLPSAMPDVGPTATWTPYPFPDLNSPATASANVRVVMQPRMTTDWLLMSYACTASYQLTSKQFFEILNAHDLREPGSASDVLCCDDPFATPLPGSGTLSICINW